jgi:hypothetical protein
MTTRTKLTAIGVSAIVATGAWTLARAQGNGPLTHRARMVLSMTGGVCGKTLTGNDSDANFKDRIRARRGGLVEWTVVNNCTAEATVMLGDWVRKGDNGTDRPFDPPGPESRETCTAAAGGRCVIILRIRGNAGVTTYSYTTSVNGVKKDPDLIIEA